LRIAQVTDIHDSPSIKKWLSASASKYSVVFITGDLGFEVAGEVIDIVKQHQNLFLTLGNHDYQLLNHGCPRILHGTKVRFGGYTIGGIGGSLPVAGFPFELSDSEFSVLCGNLGPVDIFLSHQPPYWSPIDITYSKQHAGSAAIAKYIEQTQPIISMHGHIHESSGIGKIGNTTICNPGPFFQGRYLEADIVGRKVTRAKVFYDKAIEWTHWNDLLQQSRQRIWGAPSLDRSRKA
jgi:uncharacterized protein